MAPKTRGEILQEIFDKISDINKELPTNEFENYTNLWHAFDLGRRYEQILQGKEG